MWRGRHDRGAAEFGTKDLRHLARELDGETTLLAAVHVLKAYGLYGILPPRGPLEPEDAVIVEQQWVKEWKQKAYFTSL